MKKQILAVLGVIGAMGITGSIGFVAARHRYPTRDAQTGLEQIVAVDESRMGNLDFERFYTVLKNIAETNYKNIKIGGDTKSEAEIKMMVLDTARKYGLQIPQQAPLQNQFEALQKHIAGVGTYGHVLLVYQDKNSAGNNVTELVLGSNVGSPTETDCNSVFSDAIRQLNLQPTQPERFKVHLVDFLVHPYQSWDGGEVEKINIPPGGLYLSNKGLESIAQAQLSGLIEKSIDLNHQLSGISVTKSDKDRIFQAGPLREALMWTEYGGLIDSGKHELAVIRYKNLIQEIYTMFYSSASIVLSPMQIALTGSKDKVKLDQEDTILSRQMLLLSLLQTQNKYAFINFLCDYQKILEIGNPLIDHMAHHRDEFSQALEISGNARSSFGDNLRQITKLSPSEIDKIAIVLYAQCEKELREL